MLVCHCTGQSHWDIPKGKAEANETYKVAAVRECYEEIGFVIGEKDLVKIAEVPYLTGKRLVLFFYIAPHKPEISELRCNSTYINRYNVTKPEFDDFRYIDVEDYMYYLTPRMAGSIREAIKKFLKHKEMK